MHLHYLTTNQIIVSAYALILKASTIFQSKIRILYYRLVTWLIKSIWKVYSVWSYQYILSNKKKRRQWIKNSL